MSKAIVGIAIAALLVVAAMAVSAQNECQDRGGVYVTHSDRPAECVVQKGIHKK